MQKKYELSRNNWGFLLQHKGVIIYILCVAFLALYLLFFQTNFTLTGDTWAEAFPEYVNDVLTKDPSDIIQSSWAGYLTIVPSFLTQLYISSHLPLGDIDYYFRFVTLSFAILCCAFIAHPFNRHLIKSDILRFFLAFLTLFSICHVSGLAFINIWYIGFVVIILACASSRKLSLNREILFTIFATLICLSKPSLIILPFILYRLARQLDVHKSPVVIFLTRTPVKLSWKEWLYFAWMKSKFGIVGSLTLIAAIALETYLTVFGTNGFSGGAVHASPLMLITDLFLASGTLLLKVLHIPNINIWLVLASSISVVLFFVVLFRKSKLLALTMALCLLLGIYLHIYSPDNTLDNVSVNFHRLYDDQTKLQRELIPSFMLLLALAMNIGYVLQSRVLATRKYSEIVFIVITLLLFVTISKPWDTIINQKTGQFYSVDIGNYRNSLNAEQPVCMPVAPSTFLDNSAGWFFQYKGGCLQLTSNNHILSNTFTNQIETTGQKLQVAGGKQYDLKSVILPIRTSGPLIQAVLSIRDSLTGKMYSSGIRQLPSEYQQISFNTAGLDQRDGDYIFTVSLTVKDDVSKVYTGKFANDKAAVYSLYMGTHQ